MTNFMSSPLLRGSQDLGSQFTFEEDTGALRSILNNEGKFLRINNIKLLIN